MLYNVFSDYLLKLQASQQQWWQDLEQSKTAAYSPLNQAMHELNLEDTAQLMKHAAKQPTAILDVHMRWWQTQLEIWQNVALQANQTAVVTPEKDDKRFQDQSWQADPFYHFIQQSYLLFSRSVMETIDAVEGMDSKAKERLAFFSRQAINALSPSNFIASNPELLKLTLETNGENLLTGLTQLQEDIESSADVLKIRMTNSDAFRVGEDVANTAGDVVYKNELFELIQYRPLTAKVNATPLLIVPPFINKYYILDLREKNSMVRWLVEQGHTVFMMSWRNPSAAQRHLNFEHYVTDGVVQAVHAIEGITGQPTINAAGYCIGGTLLATTVAYYAAKRMKSRIQSASFFTTLLDFSQPGEVGAYINDTVVDALTQQNETRGYMDGRSLSVTFSLLRENSLYWNYYVEHYLKGNSPVDFDLLYWNSDSTNVTASCHNFLLRELYLNNQLVQHKGVKVGGVWIDLSKIKVPSYFISTKEDHIALWQGTYQGAQKVGGDQTFVLGESGHIAGIVNHPAKNKYGFWVNDTDAETAEAWLAGATHHQGSWWSHWNTWLSSFTPEEQVAPYPQGSTHFPVLGAAPGDYVRQKLPVPPEATEKTDDTVSAASTAD